MFKSIILKKKYFIEECYTVMRFNIDNAGHFTKRCNIQVLHRDQGALHHSKRMLHHIIKVRSVKRCSITVKRCSITVKVFYHYQEVL